MKYQVGNHTSSQGRQVSQTLLTSFPGEQADPIQIVARIPASDPRVAAYAASLARQPGVTAVGVEHGLPGNVSAIDVIPAGSSQGATAAHLVGVFRDHRPAFRTWVTGSQASLADFKSEIASRAPLGAAWIALATFALLFLMTGSVLIPIKALVMNVLSLGATFGALVWVFQDGHLASLLGPVRSPGPAAGVCPARCPGVGTVGGVSLDPPRAGERRGAGARPEPGARPEAGERRGTGERPEAGEHPLARLIGDAAVGRFPVPDGGWRRVPPWRPGLEAVISFTGHAVFAMAPDITDDRLASLGADGFGGAHDPRLISALAGPEGWIDALDMLMVGRGTGRPGLPPRLADRPDLASHPRAGFAARLRDAPRVLGYPDPHRSALAIVSRGMAGLTELSFELEPGRRGQGGGARLAADALGAIPSGQLVVAAVAPGNAASVRALLSAGFVPLGSLQLFRRAG